MGLSEKELKDIALKYFDAWNQHDVNALGFLMSNDIELIDWDINCVGKKSTLAANASIFLKNPGIHAEMNELNTGYNKVFAEIVIKTADITLKVLDVISISEATKLILKIEAYRQ